jgi:hypothetical protein
MSTSDGTVKQLVLLSGDGNVGAAFNIVLVAEGYRDEDLGTFASDAEDVLAQLTRNEPFASNIKAFNVFRLDVASTEAGADDQTGKRATYFDAHFASYPPQLLLVDSGLVESEVQGYLTSGDGSKAAVHKAVVLVNTPRDGGSGGVGEAVCVASRAYGAATILHELGHTFGLTDEYAADGPGELPLAMRLRVRQLRAAKREQRAAERPPVGAPRWPNLSISYRRQDLPEPWAALIDHDTPLPTIRGRDEPPLPPDTVGAFPDLNSDCYRPQWDCTMRDCEDPFCAVCRDFINTEIRNS